MSARQQVEELERSDTPLQAPSPGVSQMIRRRQRMSQALYVSGWRWGVVCGLIWGVAIGCGLMWLAAQMGRLWVQS